MQSNGSSDLVRPRCVPETSGLTMVLGRVSGRTSSAPSRQQPLSLREIPSMESRLPADLVKLGSLNHDERHRTRRVFSRCRKIESVEVLFFDVGFEIWANSHQKYPKNFKLSLLGLSRAKRGTESSSVGSLRSLRPNDLQDPVVFKAQ